VLCHPVLRVAGANGLNLGSNAVVVAITGFSPLLFVALLLLLLLLLLLRIWGVKDLVNLGTHVCKAVLVLQIPHCLTHISQHLLFAGLVGIGCWVCSKNVLQRVFGE